MGKISMLIFPLGKHDIAGNKRLKNLSKYLSQNHSVQTKIIKPLWDYINLNAFKGVLYFLLKLACLGGNLLLVPLVLIREKKRKIKNFVYFYEGEHLMLHRFLLAKLLGYKIIVDLVENPNSVKYSESFFKKVRAFYFLIIYRLFPYFVSGVVVVSGFLKAKVLRDFRHKVPVFLLPVSFDPEDFNQPPNSYQHPTVFYGGSYGSNFDFSTLFKALNKVIVEHPDLKLFLSGKTQTGIGDLLKSHTPLSENVSFLGFLSEEEYFKTICGMDILCMPRNNTINANSGFPFKLAEYLATGKPVVTSRVSDVGEYLTDDDAFIYDPGDFNQLKKNFSDILLDPEKAKQKGLNGKKKAEIYFNATKQTVAFLTFIHSL